MHTHSSEAIAAAPPALAETQHSDHPHTEHLLYQGAIVLVVVLFFASMWSL